MTVYAETVSSPLHTAPTLTKTFNVMIWVEMDRVRMSQRFYTVTITGQQSAQPEALTYTVDGNPATMQDVAEVLAWARTSQGSVEKVAEEVAA